MNKTHIIDGSTMRKILMAQCNEITEHHIYQKLADAIRTDHNKKVLEKISKDELRHYNFWKQYTEQEVAPKKLKIWFFFIISRLFGLTFGIKLMERGEGHAQLTYQQIAKIVPEAEQIIRDEDEHEKSLIQLLDEERLKYIGSIVLGLNDALVELTGALAGFTLALQNSQLIALAGMITGIAATLSMAASEYLSTKTEDNAKSPLTACIYTGIAYMFTVSVLIAPYLFIHNYMICLGLSLLGALVIIFVFTLYVSIAQEVPFFRRFSEMATISLGVALISFLIGYLVRHFFQIDI